ncbi:hypothetical protein SAMN05216188_10625 [Lentzea xinjiangensis]|uniref:Uncharacterized protein n=1 Tax=Lentzea xinjiangensis TaxID=402600 RepID=A0A1H9JKT1_9PSEU|nr:hypothetical protein SAMN05216188_10625 [Lentzea xinjiangensis]
MTARTPVAVLLACLATGCGVSAQDEPVLIAPTGPAETTPTITIKPSVVPATTPDSSTPATTTTHDSQERR